MSVKIQTFLSGLVSRIGFFLTIWSIQGNEWSTQVIGIFPPEKRGMVTMWLAGVTVLAGIHKSYLDSHGNQRAKDTAIITGTEHN